MFALLCLWFVVGCLLFALRSLLSVASPPFFDFFDFLVSCLILMCCLSFVVRCWLCVFVVLCLLFVVGVVRRCWLFACPLSCYVLNAVCYLRCCVLSFVAGCCCFLLSRVVV